MNPSLSITSGLSQAIQLIWENGHIELFHTWNSKRTTSLLGFLLEGIWNNPRSDLFHTHGLHMVHVKY